VVLTGTTSTKPTVLTGTSVILFSRRLTPHGTSPNPAAKTVL
jgi:hypothetical protein